MNEREWDPPKAWYLVAAEGDIKPGGVKPVEGLAKPIILYRTLEGALRASHRFCPHLEADLVRATVTEDGCLNCPLHGWKFNSAGKCELAPNYKDVTRRLLQYPVIEKYGGVFVSLDSKPEFEPGFVTIREDELYSKVGESVIEVDCPWHVIAANGYDIHHFETIHRRGFYSEPKISQLSPRQLQIEIHAKVIGESRRDRIIQRLSGDSIQVRIVNHGGPLLTIETDLGFMRTHLIISLFPLGARTRVRYLLGIPKSKLGLIDPLRFKLAHRHAERFLRDDIVSLDGMRLNPKMLMPEDTHLKEFFDWMRKLNCASIS